VGLIKLNNMKGQKQSRQDLLEKKVKALINVVQQLLNENSYLKDLSVGTLEAVKLMPGYEEAIQQLTEKLKEEKETKLDLGDGLE
tara:strand:- start:586 stop:840 length:255 start_codon:yes stop_codon:yes gene_type:complete